MIGVYLSLFLLGLAAVDPVGIAAMPILLSQKRPYLRSFIFLGGSLVALIVMGLAFSRGLGTLILQVEQTYAWLVPTLESIAGGTLLVIALFLVRKVRPGSDSGEPSTLMTRRLHFGNRNIFLLGALLVSVQSVIDVVFVIAMIKVEALQLSFVQLIAGIIVYAVAALLLQIAVVSAYRLTPVKRRKGIIQDIQQLVVRYADRLVIAVSVVLGAGLLLNSLLTTMGRALF